MKCPICNSTKAAESIVGKKVYFKCGSEFDAITGEPRLELQRGHQCVASCGVCGETLPHHVSHCAGVLKRKLATPPATPAGEWPRYIVCAAMLMHDGRIVTGVRHFSPDMRSVLFALYGEPYHILVKDQGFIDNRGKFLDREEALKVAKEYGQIRRECGTTRELFSENLY